MTGYEKRGFRRNSDGTFFSGDDAAAKHMVDRAIAQRVGSGWHMRHTSVDDVSAMDLELSSYLLPQARVLAQKHLCEA